MKPTVSVSTNGARPPPETSRAAGSRVTNSWSAVGRVRAGDPVAAASSCPRSCIPTRATTDSPTSRRCVRSEPPVTLDVLERLVDLADAAPDDAPVRLELRLTAVPAFRCRRPGARGGPTALTRRGRQIRELRQLDLELALAGTRALGEDVEDQRGPVDDAQTQRAGEVPLLHGRQRIVGDRAAPRRGTGERARTSSTLPLPKWRRGFRSLALLDDAGEDLARRQSRRAGSTPPSTPPPPSASGGEAEAHEDRPVDGALYARHATVSVVEKVRLFNGSLDLRDRVRRLRRARSRPTSRRARARNHGPLALRVPAGVPLHRSVTAGARPAPVSTTGARCR